MCHSTSCLEITLSSSFGTINGILQTSLTFIRVQSMKLMLNRGYFYVRERCYTLDLLNKSKNNNEPFFYKEKKRREKNWVLTCKFPMKYKNSTNPKMEIPSAKQFSHM